MLYNHSVDLVENVNISERPENKEMVKKLSPAELPEFGDSTNNAGVYSFNQAIGFRLQR